MNKCMRHDRQKKEGGPQMQNPQVFTQGKQKQRGKNLNK